jgi:hypothetical protein
LIQNNIPQAIRLVWGFKFLYKMELEIKIEPHSSSMHFYCIYYRYKRKFNLFNSWKQLVEVWDGVNLSYDKPVMFNNFDDAVEYGKKLKDNPNLIGEHYAKENKKYQDSKQRRCDYYNSRNKSIII